jgi:transcriptional regulator with XRE-family HTH domain
MVLLRRVIGDALRARRQGQHRTLREVSTAANVSLGYLSEIERGQKEASSELLAAICDALGARLSELLGEVSDTLSLAEEMQGVLAPVGAGKAAVGRQSRSATPTLAGRAAAASSVAGSSVGSSSVAGSSVAAGAVAASSVAAAAAAAGDTAVRQVASDGAVSVSVRQETPLKATLRATRKVNTGNRGRDVVYAA